MEPSVIHEKLVGKFGEKIVSADLEAASPFLVVASDAIAEIGGMKLRTKRLLFFYAFQVHFFIFLS